MQVSLARYGGKRGYLEFEVAGSKPVTWNHALVGGHVQPRDASLFLFTIDTLRADHVGAYGYPHQTTPFLDRLAQEGTRFNGAYSAANKSVPSHATILTGRYPQSHGLLRNGQTMNQQQITLAHILSRKGYPTAAYVNWKLLAMRRWGPSHEYGRKNPAVGGATESQAGRLEDGSYHGPSDSGD